MDKVIMGKLRYDEHTDSFVYELLSNEGSWSLSMASKCVRREGAEDGEETNYVHYELLKRIVRDVEVYGVRLHFE